MSFGPLDPLHRYILDRAQPLCLANAHRILLPLLPLGIQAQLLRYPGTRTARAAICVVGVLLMVDAWTGYRFVEPWFDALNNGLGVAWLHLIAKYVEFAIIEEPVVDSVLGGFDLCINSRWLGLRKLALDPTKEGAVTWIPQATSRSRITATFRHAGLAIFHFGVVDVLITLLRTLGWDTIGRSDPPPNALDRFVHHTTFVFAPTGTTIPPWLIMLGAQLAVGVGVWQGLAAGYHTFGLLAVGTGLYDVDAWVDLFNRPWASESLIEFWGQGWHQLFRHHFLLLSSITLRTLSLNPRGSALLPLVFLLSGGMHAVGQLSMSDPPDPLRVATFFLLVGVGCALELGFSKVTGRRVRGVLGRVWFIAFTAWASTGALDAELQSGLGGSKIAPRLLSPYIAYDYFIAR